MGPTKYFGIKYLFSFLHPFTKGDLDGGLASLECVHTEIKKKKKRKKKKIRNLPLVSDLDAIGGLSTNMRPL
jgi:hypothetical protein